MSQTFGLEARHGTHATTPPQPAARYLVLIDSAADSTRLARLFLESHLQVAEFEGAGPEVQSITAGLVPEEGATGTAWDVALAAHTPAERAAAQVFRL